MTGHSKISNWQRLRRTPYQAIASVFMVFITTFITAGFILAATGSSALLSHLESKPQLTVFFQDDKEQVSVEELSSKLKNSGKVSSVRYISKDEALAIYKEQNKNDPLLLEMVTADILPASMEVFATNPTFLSELADTLRNEQGVDEVIFQKEVVDTLVSWTRTIRQIGTIFVVLLLISSFFIILTSIGMKIALKKEEIEILKLVGATPWYIKKPFIAEGMTYGFLGANMATVLVVAVYLYLNPYLDSFLKGVPSLKIFSFSGFELVLWPLNPYIFIATWMVIAFIGSGIGFFASLFTTNRYVKY